MTMPNPKDYPVLSATLVAPAVAWLVARYLPGLELTDEQATIIAAAILAAGSGMATTMVRSRRSLPDPTATRSNSAVEVRPTTYKIRDEPATSTHGTPYREVWPEPDQTGQKPLE
jgi:hypothetical protein